MDEKNWIFWDESEWDAASQRRGLVELTLRGNYQKLAEDIRKEISRLIAPCRSKELIPAEHEAVLGPDRSAELHTLIAQLPIVPCPFKEPVIEESDPFRSRYALDNPPPGKTVMMRCSYLAGERDPHALDEMIYFRCDDLAQDRTRLRAECLDQRARWIYGDVLDWLRRDYGLDEKPADTSDVSIIFEDYPYPQLLQSIGGEEEKSQAKRISEIGYKGDRSEIARCISKMGAAGLVDYRKSARTIPITPKGKQYLEYLRSVKKL